MISLDMQKKMKRNLADFSMIFHFIKLLIIEKQEKQLKDLLILESLKQILDVNEIS